MGKKRRPSKKGSWTSVEDLSSNVLNDLEGEYRLSQLVDEAQEELKQRAIAQSVNPSVKLDALIDGTSRTAEQQIARRLLFGDGELGTLPPDMFRGSDLRVNQLGVDGPIKPDSSVLGGTTGRMVRVEEDEILDLRSNGVLTEYLSPIQEENMFRAWSQIHPGEGRDKFNAEISEYMGQQMLRTIGATPVADNARSDKVQRGIRANYEDGRVRPNGSREMFIEPLPQRESTAGTDRLVENSTGLMSRDIDRSGDFRYMMDGQVRVGENQTGEPRDTIRLNLLKAAMGRGTDPRVFEANWNRAANNLRSVGSSPTANKILRSMIAQGKLPPPKRQSQGVGVRGGKAMSSDPLFAGQNNESQFRYDDLLYSHTDKGLRDKPRGYIPSDVILVDARKAGDALGVIPAEITGINQGNSINATPKIIDLIQAGAAKRLTDDPRVQQMLP